MTCSMYVTVWDLLWVESVSRRSEGAILAGKCRCWDATVMWEIGLDDDICNGVVVWR